ncbi:MAG: hypothetical protein J1E80_03755 [Desulfovibrionaceae bacterium]|nr:hypothetical protein [Desulfovibrionaceae bacterium]
MALEAHNTDGPVRHILEDFGIRPEPAAAGALEQGRRAVLARVIPLLAAGDKAETDGLGAAFSGEGR